MGIGNEGSAGGVGRFEGAKGKPLGADGGGNAAVMGSDVLQEFLGLWRRDGFADKHSEMVSGGEINEVLMLGGAGDPVFRELRGGRRGGRGGGLSTGGEEC